MSLFRAINIKLPKNKIVAKPRIEAVMGSNSRLPSVIPRMMFMIEMLTSRPNYYGGLMV